MTPNCKTALGTKLGSADPQPFVLTRGQVREPSEPWLRFRPVLHNVTLGTAQTLLVSRRD